MLTPFFLHAGIWRRPIILLNLDGFYDQLLGWISTAIQHRLISKSSASCITIVESVEKLPKAVRELSPPPGLQNDAGQFWLRPRVGGYIQVLDNHCSADFRKSQKSIGWHLKSQIKLLAS